MNKAHSFQILHSQHSAFTKLYESADASSAATLRSMIFTNLDRERQQPQLLCDFLMEIGACSTSITDSYRGTEKETPIFLEPGYIESKNVNTADNTALSRCWKSCTVTAHFAASTDLRWIADLTQESFGMTLDYHIDDLPDRDWVMHVQQSWKPILVHGIVLRFPWHTNEDVTQIAGENCVELKLEGGVAFGTGEHPTTQLCLDWIQQVLRTKSVTKVMDYGSGSGVLGLAACALDPSITSIGIDIDVDAVRIANQNAANNNLNMINYLPPIVDSMDDESKSILMRAMQKNQGTVLPSLLDGPYYDVCVANILAGPLVTLVHTLANLIKPGGALGLSGILAPQANMVIDAYRTYFEDVHVAKELEGWILITGIRRLDP